MNDFNRSKNKFRIGWRKFWRSKVKKTEYERIIKSIISGYISFEHCIIIQSDNYIIKLDDNIIVIDRYEKSVKMAISDMYTEVSISSHTLDEIIHDVDKSVKLYMNQIINTLNDVRIYKLKQQF